MDDEDEDEETPESPTHGGQDVSGPGYSQQDLSSYYEVSEGQGGQSEQVSGWSGPSHPGPPVTPPGDGPRCEGDQLSPHNTTRSSGYGSETGSPDCPPGHVSRAVVPETESSHVSRAVLPEAESSEQAGGHLSHNIRDLMNQWSSGYNMLHHYAGHHGWGQGHHHHPQYHLGFSHGYNHLPTSQPEHHK